METTIDEHIGRRIREARLLTGRERSERLTQTELGAAIGVSFQQIQKYENGSNKVSGSRLWKLADYFGVPITFFYEGLDLRESKHAALANTALVTARMIHEMPEGAVKDHVIKLVRSYHRAGESTRPV